MIDKAEFDRVAEKYGWCGSWAIWAPRITTPKSGVGDLSIFDEPHLSTTLLKLHARFVFVGLNISRDDLGALPFSNFHSSAPRATDYKLRYALQDTPYWGCYMTDVIKGHPQVSSAVLMHDLKTTPGLEERNIKALREELSFVGTKDPLLVAMGSATFQILQRNLAKEFRVCAIPHYAMQINPDKYRAEVTSRLGAFRD